MCAAEQADFFKQSRTFSEIKQEIFGKFFEAWCEIRLQDLKVATEKAMVLVDMHAGEEQSIKEGVVSANYSSRYLYATIAKNPKLNNALQTFVYDKNKALLEQTTEILHELAQTQELAHVPASLLNSESKAGLAELLHTGAQPLLFMDPFQNAYAQQVLLQAFTSPGSDLFMLLSPDTILKTLATKRVSQPLTALFGEYLPQISAYCTKEKDKYKVQQYILNQFIHLLQQKGNFTLLFKINMPDTEQPEHYILFTSPHSHSYRAFKETIMPYATLGDDGVPIFRANYFLKLQTTLFEQPPAYSIANLTDRVLQQASLYKYKSIDKIYATDSLNTNYSRENYITVFEQLRREGKVDLLNGSTMQIIRKPTPSSIVKYK